MKEGRNLYPLHRGQEGHLSFVWLKFFITLFCIRESLCFMVVRVAKALGRLWVVSEGPNSKSCLTAGSSHSEVLGHLEATKNSSSFENMEAPSELAVRDILTYNLGLGHQGTQDPILPYLLNLMLGQGFALSLGPANCCWVLLQSCFAAQRGAASGKWPCLEKPARKGGLWHGGTPWGQSGLEAAGQHTQHCTIHPLPGRGIEPCRQAWSWPVQWGKRIPRSWD